MLRKGWPRLLLNLSQRFTARGYSPSEFVLRMTREEIGSYLGLNLETVTGACPVSERGAGSRAAKAHPDHRHYQIQQVGRSRSRRASRTCVFLGGPETHALSV